MATNGDVSLQLANELVLTLPSFDRWTSSIWDSETPFGRVGHRQVQILYRLRYPIYMNGLPATASSLAELFSVRKSVVTRWLAGLEARGFIERVDVPDDRRSHLIELTESGHAVSVYIEEIFVEEMKQSIGFMSRESMEHLLEVMPLLNQISTNLEYARKERVTGDSRISNA